MKMYIVLKESVELGLAVNAVGHGVLKAHLQWEKEEGYQKWLKNSFKKATCIANDKEFEALKKEGNFLIITESALGHAEVALVFFPLEKELQPKGLRFLRLLK